MKAIDELNFPEGYHYTEDHEWAQARNGSVRIGISDYAQDQLGDIVFVELPAAGAAFKKGAAFGSVESVKAVSELYMPVAGQVTAVNTALEAAPEKVNQTPYGDGWMIEIQAGDPAEINGLLSRGAYLERLKGQS